MHTFIYYIIFFLFNPQFYINIEQKNQYIEAFNQKMETKEYKGAISIFEKLEDVHRIIDTHLRLDAAHAYYELGDTSKARLNYEYAKDVSDPLQSSVARNQLGVLALMRGDSAGAIRYFKSSIERNPELINPKYNYELISLLYKPHNPPPLSLEEEKNNQVVVSDIKEETLEEYVSDNISRERALQLLDNLRISESKALISRKNSEKIIEKDW